MSVPQRGRKWALLVIAFLLAVYAALAWLSVTSKSPTYDEPLHAVAGWLQIHEGDFRVDPEDPPLWKYWAALPTRRSDIKADLTLPPGTQIPEGDGVPHYRKFHFAKTLPGPPVLFVEEENGEEVFRMTLLERTP